MSLDPRALLPDLSPWRSSRDFRTLWWSGAVTLFGSFLSYVALPFQLKELTDSPVAVGALGAAELVPLILFGLYGGALADAVDRRTVIVWTEAALGLVALGLLGNALLPHPAVWPLYAAGALTSSLVGLQRPALDAVVPRIVPHEQLGAAAALNSLRWQFGGVAGPALAGVLIAYSGVATAYALDAASFALSLLLALRLSACPAGHDADRPSLRRILEGARYAWSRKELLGTYVVDVTAMLFAFPLALFPFLADRLDARWALGMMYAALPLGGLLVSATSGWTGRMHRHGRMVAVAALGWGVAVALAGAADNIWLVLLLLTLAGACDMVSGIFRSTLWNQTIPDGLRGRLAGIELLSFSAGPQLGQLRSGGMAALTSVRTSVWGGGLLCVAAVGALMVALPALMAYDARTNPHAQAKRRSGTTPPPEENPAPA
ncbi:MFS transporter [Streptomyces sp. TR06-5]|uniref:MFS transporter n=1 Tax=unclassified Streptomyces TaxID=2593676 RepID=UPI0039A2D2F8